MALASTYANGARVIVRNGKLIVVDASGREIKGAVPTVTGAGRGYRAPVTTLEQLPSRSYDPSLGYQSQNANLGLLYNNQDFQTAYGGYDAAHPDQQPGDLAAAGTAVQDYWRQRGALAEALARAQQDYGTGTETLGRNYRILGNNQRQAINAAGAIGGGALAQALAKRHENQGREQSALDTSWQRYQQDNTRGVDDLTTNYRRGYATGQTTLGRAGESNALYQGGLFGTAAAQANQSGMLADNPNYQTHNGVLYQVMPDGTRVPVKKKKRRPGVPTDSSLHPAPYPGYSGSSPLPTGVVGNPYASYPNI